VKKIVLWLGGGILALTGFVALANSGPTVTEPSVLPASTSTISTIQSPTPAPTIEPTAIPTVAAPPVQPTNLSNNDYYTNNDGNSVHSPASSSSVPAGASAQCGDGTYSFSLHRSGTCSHHGGVATWL